MLQALKREFRRRFPNLRLGPQGSESIKKIGHRQYVGGAWDEIGQLQFDWPKSRGMQPHHYLLDIACGSLRLGVKAIPYLDKGHYLGIEKEQDLLDAGVQNELGSALFEEKTPQLVQSSAFEFEKFDEQPDFAIAQSLFTHLTPEIIDLCFEKLRPRMKDNTLFYATYFLTESGFENPAESHDHGYFAYSRDEMLGFGTRHGFKAEYIGDWNHPRNQRIVEYRI